MLQSLAKKQKIPENYQLSSSPFPNSLLSALWDFLFAFVRLKQINLIYRNAKVSAPNCSKETRLRTERAEEFSFCISSFLLMIEVTGLITSCRSQGEEDELRPLHSGKMVSAAM